MDDVGERPCVAVLAGAVGVQPGIGDGAVAAVESAVNIQFDRLNGHIAVVSYDRRSRFIHICDTHYGDSAIGRYDKIVGHHMVGI